MNELAIPKEEFADLFAEQPDLAPFITTLRRVKGFALYFAHCNVPTYRAKLTEAIRSHLTRPLVVLDTSPLAEMDKKIRSSVNSFVEQQLERVPEDAVVFIVGLENLLLSRDEGQVGATIQELNWRRDFLQRMPRPMVFWLPEYALTLVARNAPELYDAHSGVYDLELPKPMQAQISQETLGTIPETEGQRWMTRDESDHWESVLRELLAAAEANSDPDNLSQAEAIEQSDLLDRLGQLFHLKAEDEEAEDYLARALKIEEAAFGPNHPNVATRLKNLASLLQNLGELHNARDLFERALNIEEAVFGPNHPNIATTLNNFAFVLIDLRELQHARKLYERALNIEESAFGPNHFSIATVLSNLALVFDELGEFQTARNLLERSLKIAEAAYGPNHPHVARVLNNLAFAFKALGELQNARNYFERSFKIYEAVFGPDHSNTITSLTYLALVLQELGEFQYARELFERSLKAYEVALGPNHPSVGIRLRNLALVLQELGELQNARDLLERSIRIHRQFDDESPTVKYSENKLKLLLKKMDEVRGE